MKRIYFGDIFANNLGDFSNNSTKFGEILDMSKIHFPTNFYRAVAYTTWHLLAFKPIFKKRS